MDKTSFGQLNWSLAFLLIAFYILGFGIDQLTVRKIAAGEKPEHIISIYIFHVIATGLLFYCLILLTRALLPGRSLLTMLALIGIGKLAMFLSQPFKQSAAGMEKFNLFAKMSVISNITRGVALIICSLLHILQLNSIIFIFITGDIAELAASVYIYQRYIKTNSLTIVSRNIYGQLLKEARPQIGVVIAAALISRFDWLLIGLIASAAQLAEYSFAYKAYELSTLPLLVIAPLLIPRFVKYFKKEKDLANIYNIIKLEVIVCSLIIVVLNVIWAPAADMITGNKYGAVNRYTIFLLSLSTPLLYLNNILWTIAFAKGKLRHIFLVTFATCCINVVADCILIPLFKNEGAAAACLVSLGVQSWLYIRQEYDFSFRKISHALVSYPLCAITSIYVASLVHENLFVALFISITLYTLLVLALQRFTKNDIRSGIRILTPDF